MAQHPTSRAAGARGRGRTPASSVPRIGHRHPRPPHPAEMRPARDPLVCPQQRPRLTAVPVAPRRSSGSLPPPGTRPAVSGWARTLAGWKQRDIEMSPCPWLGGAPGPFHGPRSPRPSTCEPAPTSPWCLSSLLAPPCVRMLVRAHVFLHACACVCQARLPNPAGPTAPGQL